MPHGQWGAYLVDIKQLQYFTEVYRQKSFSKAAEHLYISQQGISMAIFRLEEELSCKLFCRSGKELELTEQGEFLLERAEKILEQFQICEDYFERERAMLRQARELKLASAYGVMPEFAGDLIFRFRQAHPDVWVGVQEYKDLDCEDAVWNEQAELGFAVGPVDSKKFEVSPPLFTRRFCLMVHKSHPLASEETVSVDVLRTTPIMIVDERFKTYETTMRCCRRRGFQPEVFFKASEVIAIHRLVSDNRGVGISVESVGEALDHPNVKTIPFIDPRMVWNVHLICKRDKTLSGIAHTFEKFASRQQSSKEG